MHLQRPLTQLQPSAHPSEEEQGRHLLKQQRLTLLQRCWYKPGETLHISLTAWSPVRTWPKFCGTPGKPIWDLAADPTNMKRWESAFLWVRLCYIAESLPALSQMSCASFLRLWNRANTSPSHSVNEMKDAQRLSIVHKNVMSLIRYKLAATLKLQKQFNSIF